VQHDDWCSDTYIGDVEIQIAYRDLPFTHIEFAHWRTIAITETVCPISTSAKAGEP
jgi:hypothetical protein